MKSSEKMLNFFNPKPYKALRNIMIKSLYEAQQSIGPTSKVWINIERKEFSFKNIENGKLIEIPKWDLIVLITFLTRHMKWKCRTSCGS